jgi:2-desacetyl-2-hydroxyethyl bacteriochlorophyllide A dehydrogenase
MNCSVFMGKERIETIQRVMPKAGPGEVVVKVMAAGVCGTDVHIFFGEAGSAEVNPPVVLGHEFAGEVVETGKRVVGIKTGDRVTVDPNIYCGKCDFCRNGKKQHCDHLSAIGVSRDGGYEQFCVVPQEQAFKLDDHVDYEEGAMVEPIACCLHGIELMDIVPGQTVCVVGGGAIGLIMAQLDTIRGASKVIVSEPIEERRKIALEIGADAVADPFNGDINEQIKAHTGRTEVDAVIECAGLTSATKQAFMIAGKGATVLLFSVPKPDATFALPLFDVFKKELKIMGSFINPSTHLRATSLVNAGKLNLKPIITHRFPLAGLDQAIKKQMGNDSIKVLIMPQE